MGAHHALTERLFGPAPPERAAPTVDVDAYIFGSWAARWVGEKGPRPVADIDLLVLGQPDRDSLYVAVDEAGRRLGREVQVTIREPGWLEAGSDSFHATVTSRPMVRMDLQSVAATDEQGRRA